MNINIYVWNLHISTKILINLWESFETKLIIFVKFTFYQHQKKKKYEDELMHSSVEETFPKCYMFASQLCLSQRTKIVKFSPNIFDELLALTACSLTFQTSLFASLTEQCKLWRIYHNYLQEFTGRRINRRPPSTLTLSNYNFWKWRTVRG